MLPGMDDGHRKVGVTTCTTLVMANMIGTGVFTSLGFQIAVVPSPFLLLLLWGLGGLVALCGAMCYAELAAALPRSGGEYNFLTRIYHPALGFMAGFISLIVGFAAPTALAAMAAGKYLGTALPGLPPLGISAFLVIAMAAAHSRTVRLSGAFQVLLTSLKIGLIVAFIGFGFALGFKTGLPFRPEPGDMQRLFSGPFAVSLMFVLYAYSGWNAAAYIINEVRDPQRTIPRALLQATAVVTILYVLLNAVFLGSAPLADYAGKLEAGEIAATALFGVQGGRIMAGLIGLGLISAVSAMTWAGPRVANVIGEDFPMLGFLAKLGPGGVPQIALAVQTVLVLIMLFRGTFETILIYAQFALLSCGFLTVLGLFVLRWRQPDLARPFRCWGYPVTPLIYLSLALFAIIYAARDKPEQAEWGFATMVLGIVLFFVARGRK